MTAAPKLILPAVPTMSVPFEPGLVIRDYGGLVATLRRLREQRGWTIEDLDGHANWTERYGSHLENWTSNHGRQASSAFLQRWMVALDVALVPIDWPSGDAERPFLRAVDLSRRPRRDDP